MPGRLTAVLPALLLLAAAPACADETLVRYLFQQRFPTARVESVARTPLPDLYEVYADGRIWYVDGNVDYFLQGTLADARTRRNLTEERLRRLAAVPVDELPLELAFALVRGNGSRRIAVFTDPSCAACRQLERQLAQVSDVTQYVFLLPQGGGRSAATVLASRIWCAGDRAAAWQWAVLEGGDLTGPEDCITPFARVAELAARYRVAATPTVILADGSRLAGPVGVPQIQQALDLVQRRSALPGRE